MRTSLHSLGGEADGGCLKASSSSHAPARALGAAITLYALWNARDLLGAWLHSPYDRCGSFAFLLWLVPAGFYAATWRAGARGGLSSLRFAAALALSFFGIAAEVSALKYAGLAVALTGFLPASPAALVWLACAASWMPGTGWAFSSHGVVLINSFRLVIGLAAAALTPLIVRRAPLH